MLCFWLSIACINSVIASVYFIRYLIIYQFSSVDNGFMALLFIAHNKIQIFQKESKISVNWSTNHIRQNAIYREINSNSICPFLRLIVIKHCWESHTYVFVIITNSSKAGKTSGKSSGKKYLCFYVNFFCYITRQKPHSVEVL